MKPKNKALLFNFLGFALLFLLLRFILSSVFDLHNIFLAILAAIGASILSPKFGVVRTEQGKKVMMKWILMKGTREV